MRCLVRPLVGIALFERKLGIFTGCCWDIGSFREGKDYSEKKHAILRMIRFAGAFHR